MRPITIDLDAWESLPPQEMRAMMRAIRFADDAGYVHASMSTLSMPGWSRSSAHRDLAEANRDELVTREPRQGRHFTYRLAERFRPIRRPTWRDAAADPIVPQRGTHKEEPLTSTSKSESDLEREALSEGEISEEWIAAATTARRRVDLPDVNLRLEWAKLVVKEGGPSRSRWLVWALRARLDATNRPAPKAEEARPAQSRAGVLPDRDDPVLWKARLRTWKQTGGRVWPVDAGPRPDQPGCWAPEILR